MGMNSLLMAAFIMTKFSLDILDMAHEWCNEWLPYGLSDDEFNSYVLEVAEEIEALGETYE